ncbi:MAG: hypothetical protein IT374_00850 [Polyangiaceae bacterium]|nr:hypothetical protein [Polyangiaceae bacterium]
MAALFALCGCAHDPPQAPAPSASVAGTPASVTAPAASAHAPAAAGSQAAAPADPSAAPPASSAAPPDPAPPDPSLVAAKHDKPAGDPEEGDAPAEVDPKNKAKPPLSSKHLTSAARALFRAVKEDEPGVAKGFFFPREPFLPLKDIKNPGKYWDQLYRVYERDIHELHKRRAKDWDDAEFGSFELGSAPTWVKPGEEANKIGYYRTFNGKLRYKARGKERVLEVKTIISWNHRWYITHLLPFKKK